MGNSSFNHRSGTAPLRGFTIVELLVVMAVLTVLISILLPAVSHMRESGRSVQCLNNLRQIGNALVMYSQDNNYLFPLAATGDWNNQDWIYWEPGRNPQSNVTVTGAIMSYIGSPAYRTMAVCPSDDVEFHYTGYQYSYSVNWHVCPPYANGAMETPMRSVQIHHPNLVILAIDESSVTIDDGCWAPEHYFSDGHNLLSNRHDRNRENATSENAGIGTVAFCDGHAAFIERIDSLSPTYYNPRMP